MRTVLVPRRPRASLLVHEVTVAKPVPLHMYVPTVLRRQLKAAGPKVEVGKTWKQKPVAAPHAGETPVLTPRTITQVGGSADSVILDPALAPPPVNWARISYVFMVVGLAVWGLRSFIPV